MKRLIDITDEDVITVINLKGGGCSECSNYGRRSDERRKKNKEVKNNENICENE